jgi:hypothetical protein
LDDDEHQWPWDLELDPLDFMGGISPQYSDWRSVRGLPLIQPELIKATTEKPSANKNAAVATARQHGPSERSEQVKMESPGILENNAAIAPKSASQKQYGPSEQSGRVKMESPDI